MHRNGLHILSPMVLQTSLLTRVGCYESGELRERNTWSLVRNVIQQRRDNWSKKNGDRAQKEEEGRIGQKEGARKSETKSQGISGQTLRFLQWPWSKSYENRLNIYIFMFL